MSPGLHLLVPGSLANRTGGTIYDARMAAGLRAQGWQVTTHELPGRFPLADSPARAAMNDTLAAVPDGATALIDGLALGDNPGIAEHHRRRLFLLALMHHPLADESGLDAVTRRRFLEGETRALAACHGVIVTSTFTARRITALGVPHWRCRVVEPGTDPAQPAAGPGEHAPPELLCVASVTPRKSQDVLVDALATLDHLPWQATLAGSLDAAPAFADDVRGRIRRAGLGARIRLAGTCDEATLARLYHRASIFVLPSRYEGYGMALTEALVRGLPVISTTGGAIPGTVPSSAAQLVPPGDTDALTAALEHWLHDTRARASAMRAALHHAGNLQTWPEAAERFTAAIQELGGGTP